MPGLLDPKANIFKLVYDWLRDERKGPWVIILDSVDDLGFLNPPSANIEATATTEHGTPKQLKSYIPYCEHGSVLITSRDSSTALALVARADIIPIEPMEEIDALQLLRHKLGQSDDEACAVELVVELDRMPLAIAQAAAYISQRQPRWSLQKYLVEFRNSNRRKASLLGVEDGRLRQDAQASLFGLAGDDYRRDVENNNSILLTWQMSFDYIHKIRSSASDLLALMSFCDRQGIPETLLRVKNHDMQGDGAHQRDDENFENDIVTLRNFCFITIDRGATSFEMHRLVQLATHEWLKSQSSYEQWQHRFLVRLSTELRRARYKNWKDGRIIFPSRRIDIDRTSSRQKVTERVGFHFGLGSIVCHRAGKNARSRDAIDAGSGDERGDAWKGQHPGASVKGNGSRRIRAERRLEQGSGVADSGRGCQKEEAGRRAS